MRRLLAMSVLAAATFGSALAATPAQASYTCLPDDDSGNAVCVQVGHCTDLCFIQPGVYVKCYLGFRGEAVCRIVRLVGFEVGGR